MTNDATLNETVGIDIDDAIELSELLDFISDWLTGAPRMVRTDFERFVGADGYSLDELRASLAGWSNRLLSARLGELR